MIQTWSSFSLVDPCSMYFCFSVKPKFFTPTHVPVYLAVTGVMEVICWGYLASRLCLFFTSAPPRACTDSVVVAVVSVDDICDVYIVINPRVPGCDRCDGGDMLGICSQQTLPLLYFSPTKSLHRQCCGCCC